MRTTAWSCCWRSQSLAQSPAAAKSVQKRLQQRQPCAPRVEKRRGRLLGNWRSDRPGAAKHYSASPDIFLSRLRKYCMMMTTDRSVGTTVWRDRHARPTSVDTRRRSGKHDVGPEHPLFAALDDPLHTSVRSQYLLSRVRRRRRWGRTHAFVKGAVLPVPVQERPSGFQFGHDRRTVTLPGRGRVEGRLSAWEQCRRTVSMSLWGKGGGEGRKAYRRRRPLPQSDRRAGSTR